MMVLDYSGGPSIITRVLVSGRWRQKRKNQRNGFIKRISPDVAGFEDGAMGP